MKFVWWLPNASACRGRVARTFEALVSASWREFQELHALAEHLSLLVEMRYDFASGCLAMHQTRGSSAAFASGCAWLDVSSESPRRPHDRHLPEHMRRVDRRGSEPQGVNARPPHPPRGQEPHRRDGSVTPRSLEEAQGPPTLVVHVKASCRLSRRIFVWLCSVLLMWTQVSDSPIPPLS
jgi:hypothetical protein